MAARKRYRVMVFNDGRPAHCAFDDTLTLREFRLVRRVLNAVGVNPNFGDWDEQFRATPWFTRINETPVVVDRNEDS